MRRSSRLAEKRVIGELKQCTIEILSYDVLTAVLVELEEDAPQGDAAPHIAITKVRRICRSWRTLIDTDGFAKQWYDARCILSRRMRRAVLGTLGAAAKLDTETWRAARLLRDMRSSRLPRLADPLQQTYSDPNYVDAHGVAHYSWWSPVKFTEDCVLVLLSLGGLLMVVAFTGQLDAADDAGINHRSGFSLHVWTGTPGFVRVLAVTTVDSDYPVATAAASSHGIQEHSSHAGSRLAPLRHVYRPGLDLLRAGAAAAGHGDLRSDALLAVICVAALARCGHVDDPIDEGYQAYVRIVINSAADPISSPLEHRNVARGEADGEVFPGLELLYWGAGGAASDELRQMLATELVRWQPEIAEGRGWWPPLADKEWRTVAEASQEFGLSVRGCQVCCSKCIRQAQRRRQIRENQRRLIELGILSANDVRFRDR